MICSRAKPRRNDYRGPRGENSDRELIADPYVLLKKQVQAFEKLAAYVNGFANLTGAGDPETAGPGTGDAEPLPTLGAATDRSQILYTLLVRCAP